MTPDEIITLARTHFGEATASSLGSTQMYDFFNQALKILYEDLPPNRQRALISVDALALTAGEGTIPSSYDKILKVFLDDVPGVQVVPEVIEGLDYGSAQSVNYFSPIIPVFAISDSTIWVRPTTATCEIEHLDPPTEFDSLTAGNELVEFDDVFHPALALLVASLAYAQEEDTQQANYYLAQYNQSIAPLLVGQGEGSE